MAMAPVGPLPTPCGCPFALNPPEAFVFSGAALLHDAAMTFAAYPGGLADLKTGFEESDDDEHVVGSAGAEITRFVTVYSRANPEG
jgi:hypothetical protein